MNEKIYFVYILTNPQKTVLYIGITSNLSKRIYEHQQKFVEGFSRKYNLVELVHFEETSDVLSALEREKQIKRWRREKKETLINTQNPKWVDLSYLL